MKSSLKILKSNQVIVDKKAKAIDTVMEIREALEDVKSQLSSDELSQLDVRLDQLSEMEQQTESMLEKAQKESEDLLQQAQVEAEQLKETAEKEGFEAGHTQGYSEGYEEGFEKGFHEGQIQVES